MADDILTAEFKDTLERVNVSLCFAGQAPEYLYRHEQAGAFTDGIYQDGKRLRISKEGSSVRLPTLPEDTCLRWQVSLTAALKKKDYRLVVERGPDLVMAAGLWFWKGPSDRNLVVDIKLPDGMSISTPWMLLGKDNGKTRYRPDKTPANWESRLAVGRFKIDSIELPGARIRLAIVGGQTPSSKQNLRTWIEETLLSVTSVSGRFPQPQPQVLVVPIGARHEAVVKAHVMRGGGLAAEFFVDETRPLKEFRDDWTATHEFSHMLVPYISSRDRWLSEGLASYYQNVLRARDGRLSETQAWQKLYEGFKRGEDGTRKGSLAQATRRGRHSTMRVYWSGAAMMLMADMQLRESSDGRQSLDTALQSISGCCMENGRTWRASEMFKQLDNLTGTVIFTGLYRKYVHGEGFPDMHSTWENLGIDIRNNQVKLSDDAPLADLRSTIMKG